MDHDLADCLLRLRRDATYLKTEDGIFFRTPLNDFSLKGQSIYESFNALVPYLDGTMSKQTLCERMSEGNRSAAAMLLDVLVNRKVLYCIDPTDRAMLDTEVASCFSAQIDYLNHFTDNPASRFLAFRNARILLLGGGEALIGAGLSLLSNGLKKITIASADSTDLDDPLWEQTQTALAEQGVTTMVIRHEPRTPSPTEFDLVIYCNSTPDFAVLHRLVSDRQVRLLPAFRLGDHSFVGPCAGPDEAGCWLCAMMRWSKRVPSDRARDFWREMVIGRASSPAAPMSSVTAQMLGNSVALEAYKLFVDVAEPETRAQLLEQNLDTLETAVRRFLPDPGCPRCRAIEFAPSAPDASDIADAIARWMPYMGHNFASHAAFDDGTIEQLPISISAIPTPDGPIYGSSTENAIHARAAALGEAIRRDLIAGDALFVLQNSASTPPVAASHIGSWLGNGDPNCGGATIDGTRLDNTATVLISAAALHPSLDQGGYFDFSHAGIGVGVSRDEAEKCAIFDLFEHVAIEALADGTLPLWKWSEAGTESDDTTRHLLSIIHGFGVSPPAVAITECYGLAIAIVLPADEQAPVAGEIDVASAFTVPQAVQRLLERYVARLQVERLGLTWRNVPRRGVFMNLPVALPALAGLPVSFEPPVADIVTLAARLACAGTTLVVCDLTPPDVRACGGYIVIKALLLRSEAEA